MSPWRPEELADQRMTVVAFGTNQMNVCKRPGESAQVD